MGWVIAVLIVACVFFVAQIMIDYIRAKSHLGPKVDQAEAERKLYESRAEEHRALIAESKQRTGQFEEEIIRLEEKETRLREEIKEEQPKSRENVSKVKWVDRLPRLKRR